MAGQRFRKGRVTRLVASGTVALGLVLGSAACTGTGSPTGAETDGSTPTATTEAKAATTAREGRPSIGAGDPMLGATDGVERPELADIPTEQLDSTNALELAERFRRTFEDETVPSDQWVADLKSSVDPTFAVSLTTASRGYFVTHKSEKLRIEGGYTLGATEPYATVIASDADGNDMWKARLAIKLSKADPSIGTWSVVSVDWIDASLSEGKAIPLTEDTRNNVRVTSTFASAGVFRQSLGEDPNNRFAALQNYLLDPQHAAARGKPVPDRDTAVEALDPTATYFVTPPGAGSIWVEVDGGYRTVAADGSYGEPVQSIVYVEMVPDGDTYAGKDVYTEGEFKAATGQ